MGENGSAWEKAGVEKRKHSRKRVVSIAASVLALVLLILVLFAPKIASPIARGMVASKGSEAIPGSIDVRGLSLSWLGPQRVSGLTLDDPEGERIAAVDVAVEAGLLGLLFGNRDLGTITVSGRVDLEEDETGELNLLRAVSSDEPAAEPGGGGLPPSLRAVVVLDAVEVSYAGRALAERGVAAMTLGPVDGRAEIAPGQDVTASLTGIVGGRAAGGDAFRSGTVSMTASIAGLIAADGSIDAESAAIEATVRTEDLDPALADRLVDAPVAFAEAFGSPVRASVNANGTLSAPGAVFEIASANISAGGAVDLQDSMIVSREPIVVSASSAALEAIDPAWLAEVTGGTLDVHAMPSLGLQISGVRVPTGGGSLAAASGEATAELGAMEATVSVGEGAERETRRITAAPATLRIGTEALGDGARVDGSMAFTVDGRAGGTLGVDIAATQLLDEGGAFRADGLPVLRGSLGLDGVDTGVLEPFVAAAGVSLAREVGPTLSLGVDLEPQAGGAITLINGRVASANVNGALNLALEGTVLSAGDPGGQIRVASVGPLLTRMFDGQGVVVREGAAVEMTLVTLGVDLAGALSGAGMTASDVDASGEFILGPTSGGVLVEGVERAFSIEQVGAFIEMAGSRGAVQARLTTGGTFDGRPAGQVAVELRAADMIGEGGAFGLPSAIAGRAEFIGVSTAIIEPFLDAETPRPTDFIGPTVDFVLGAAPAVDGKTKLTAALTSDQLTGDGAFLFSRRAFEVDPEEGFTLVHSGLAAALAGMIDTGEAVRLRETGATAEIHVSRLIVPLDEQTRSMRLGEMDLAARAEVRTLFLDPAASGETVEVRSVVINSRLKPGEPASVMLRPTLYSGRDRLQGEGTFTVPGLMAALGGTGGLDLGSLGPSGSIAFEQVPAAILAQGLAMANLEGLDTDALARDIAGETFGVTLGVRPEGGAVRATVVAAGDRLTLDAHAVVAETLQEAGGTGEIKLSQPGAVSLMRFALPEMADTVSVVGTTGLRIRGSLSPDGVLTGEAQVPAMTLRGLDEQDLRIGIDGSFGMNRQEGAADAGAAAGGPMTMKLNATIDDAATRAGVATVSADLVRGADQAITGTVGARGLRMAWADRLLGTEDLYTGLLGETVGFSGDLTQAGSTTALTATIDAPTLRDASALSVQMNGGAVSLDKPFRAVWRGDRAWLNARLARTLAEQAPVFDEDLDVDVRLRALALPGREASGAPFALDLITRVDRLDLTMPGGETRAYRQVQLVARNGDDPTGVSVVARGDVRIGDAEPVRAIDLTADIHDLTEGGVLTPERAYANISGRLEHVPTSLIDALAGSNGWMTRMLGDEVSVDRLEVERAPLEGGTVALDLSSPASSAKVSGSFRDAEEDGSLVEGFFVLDEGGYVELSRFEESFTKDLFNVVPIFGEFERSPDSDRPSRIEIRSGRVPLSGAIEDVRFDLLTDLGTMQYGLSGPLEQVLERTGQRSFGRVGGKIDPFDVRMSGGVISYENLVVPLGEFAFASRGDVDIVRGVKDLLVQMPLGAFLVEALNLQGPAAALLDKGAVVPMQNAGALDAKQWKPDFSQAIRPGNLLEGTLKEGLKDLLKRRPGAGDSGGGGGGGG